jgi:hypothetical protein
MRRVMKLRDVSVPVLRALMCLLCASGCIGAAKADVTFEVAGDLLKHGGVVVVYPIPVENGADSIGADAVKIVRLDARYTEVQFRYPANEKYAYVFKSIDASANADQQLTEVLSIFGVDEKDRGPQMTSGFKEAYSSGGSVIRVPAVEERLGPDEATRTNSRWGQTERYDAPPPADERSARALESIVGHHPRAPELVCSGSTEVQTCVVPADQWSKLESRWWRAIAEQRLERLQHHALRRCYDSSWLGGGTCDPDPASNEPEFVKRK